MAIATVNPATGETLKTFEPHSAAEVEDRIARAADAFAAFRRTSFGERAGWMVASAGILEGERDTIAAVMTTEMGKTFKAARAEVEKRAKASRCYAAHA